MYDIIKKKRDGEVLSREEIAFFVQGYTAGEIPDYQASALCMAIYFRGLNETETAVLTEEMAHSGDTVDLSQFGDKTVDKHSTGGVGDKTTLIVAPIVASLGCVMAKMSGRGLGHTGGTVDKLEAIEGFRTMLSPEEFFRQVEKIGIAVVGQTGNLTPADKKLYALRDVTATVDSLPLIASSIMSKKLAAGAKTIVLDVKCGSGAFMKTPEDARKLAAEMVRIGKNAGRNMAAVITNMDMPLGSCIGNSLEVTEALEVLRGMGPEDLRVLCVTLAGEIVALQSGISISEAELLVNDAIDSGKALNKFSEWIGCQGGNSAWVNNPSLFPKARFSYVLRAQKSGFLAKMDAEKIGIAGVLLGAGREKKEDAVDASAGIVLNKKVGDYVNEGETLCTLFSSRESCFSDAAAWYLIALTFSDTAPAPQPIVYEILR